MKKLIRKLSRVNHSSILRCAAAKSDVPAGHLPVFVGLDHMERRFVVNAELLRHPIFLELLDRSAQEYGYGQSGVLKIPINAAVFERVLDSLRRGRPLSTLDDVVRSASLPPVIEVR